MFSIAFLFRIDTCYNILF